MKQIVCDFILFDLDGVLIDSSASIARHWKAWADRHGIDPKRIMQVAHGMRTIETMRMVAPHLNVEEEAKQFAAAEIADSADVVVLEGASPLLDSLPPDAWGIVTSGSRALASVRLRHAGLPIPGILVTADDVSRGKPDPEPYLLGAKRASRPADRCVVVEDSPAGIQAAKAAGIRVIAITSTHAPYELHTADTIVSGLSSLQVTSGARNDGRLRVKIEAEG